MIFTYKQLKDPLTGEIDTKMILRKEDNAFIPVAEGNRDYQEYLKWKADGGVPEEAD